MKNIIFIIFIITLVGCHSSKEIQFIDSPIKQDSKFEQNYNDNTLCIDTTINYFLEF